MSLNWNITNVENWKKKQKSKKKSANLNALIWATLIIGVGNITKKNYKKFYARLTAYEHLHGAFMYRGDKPYYITLEDVEDWVGLKTNAGDCSAAEFERRLMRED